MENDFRSIKYLNKDVKILKYLSESETQFNQRLEFIKKLEEKNTSWKEAERLSKLWYCITIKKCQYSPEVHNSIKI